MVPDAIEDVRDGQALRTRQRLPESVLDSAAMRIGPLLPLLIIGSLPSSAHAGSLFDDELAARRAEVTRLAGKPEAIVPLLGILDLWTMVDDRAPIAAALDEVAADKKQRADVRARAIYLRSIVADRVGEADKARALRGSLGLLGAWQVVGPFDNEGKGGHARQFPVEKELAGTIDPTRDYPGIGAGEAKKVRWRVLSERLLTQGMVPLDAAIRPDTNTTAYLTTFVKVDVARDAAIHVGSTGAIKVWVGNRLALDHEVYRPVRIDQDVAGARLAAGWNRITVKVSAAEAGWAAFVRLTQPNGEPLKFEASSTPPAALATASGKAPKVADLGADLRKAASVKTDAAAARALGIYLHFVAPDDPQEKGAERQLQRALELAPSSAMARLAAMAASDQNDRRKLLEEAAGPELTAKAPPADKARALLDLGEAYGKLHRERRAEELFRSALAVDPEIWPATMQLAGLAADRGLPSRGLAMVDEVAKKHPALALVSAGAQLADRLGLRGEVELRYRAIAKASADDLTALRELYTISRSRGDLDAALKLLDSMAQARPDLPQPSIDRAELLDGAGRGDDAHQVLAHALEACPDDSRLLERDGRLLHRLGRDDESLERFRRALVVRPQNPELRAYLREVESRGGAKKGSGADDLARAYTQAVSDVRKRAASAPPDPASPARVLLDLSATRVHGNGLSETFNQRVVEILDERGAREQGDVDIKYTPDSQSVEVRAAKVYKKSGEVFEASAQTDRDLSEPWYGLYYDVKAMVIEFPKLERGDVIDVEYVVSDVGRRNLFADYFGDLHVLQEDLPRVESDYVLITPKSRAFYFNQPRLPNIEQTKQEQGDETVYRFHARNVPKVEAEPGMPGFTDVAAYVHVSTYKTWEDVAQWYWGLVHEELTPDENIKRAVAEAVKGLSDERARIRAVYDLVVKKTRYVGLEFGIHGYKPYRVTQVFARKFGDCKDKASLLVAMLKEIHVPATLVLARTRHGGDLDGFPASLAPFDHAIAYVPKYKLFLDGTAEFSGSDELPAQDQDIPVLLVTDPAEGGKGHLARTPVLTPEKNRVTRDLRVALDASGAAKVQVRMTVSGEAAHEWRSHYQTAGERRERFEKAENASHPGAKVTRVEFPTIDDLERPVEVRSELEVPIWARASGHDLAMPALGRDGELSRSYARLSTRQHDLVLGYPWEQEEHVEIALPKGYTPKRLPEARRIDTPFGTFAVTVERRGQEVALTTALKVSRHRIGRKEYAAFRQFCLDVDAAAGQELVLVHE
jgi:tetratricopeptide (TPR) repeat protein